MVYMSVGSESEVEVRGNKDIKNLILDTACMGQLFVFHLNKTGVTSIAFQL